MSYRLETPDGLFSQEGDTARPSDCVLRAMHDGGTDFSLLSVFSTLFALCLRLSQVVFLTHRNATTVCSDLSLRLPSSVLITVSLYVSLRGKQYKHEIGLDWPRLINGVALIDARSVVILIVVAARMSSVDCSPDRRCMARSLWSRTPCFGHILNGGLYVGILVLDWDSARSHISRLGTVREESSCRTSGCPEQAPR